MSNAFTQPGAEGMRRSLLHILCVRFPLGILSLVTGLSVFAGSVALAGSTADVAAQQNFNQPSDARMDLRSGEIKGPDSLKASTGPRPIVIGHPLGASTGPRPISNGKQVEGEHTRLNQPQGNPGQAGR